MGRRVKIQRCRRDATQAIKGSFYTAIGRYPFQGAPQGFFIEFVALEGHGVPNIINVHLLGRPCDNLLQQGELQ
jgi:hypothetical protein